MLLKEKILKFVVFLSILGLGSFVYLHNHGHGLHPYAGYVEGEYVRVATSIAGELINLPVKRGMTVTTGHPLFTLEHQNELAARDEAAQRFEKARFDLENLKTGKRPEEIEVIKETLNQAEADQEFAELFLKRQEKLVLSNSTSFENLDRARSTYQRGLARIAELKGQLKVAQLPARDMEIKVAEKDVEAAQAVLRQAEWRLDQKAIKSSVSGLVFDTLYVAGEWVSAGSPIVVLLPPENIKVRFFVPEEDLTQLQIGGSVTISCDGLDKAIPATISYISPTAEYTPPIIYSREWRTKLIYMIEAHPLETPEILHPGQPVDVTVGLS